jgi:hypothetical protein
MASRGEGFGLPLIEAASHRRHVLARDLPVFREQELSNALYFDDDDPAMLGERLMMLAALGAQGRPAVPDLPTWSDSVDGLLKDIGLSQNDAEPLAKPVRTAS